ncbi:hypothetical protein J6590_039107 [Homalodisca vitripennis]|nr:hypothetical protein J6590_039107 [Homalodisca vitripennis]
MKEKLVISEENLGRKGKKRKILVQSRKLHNGGGGELATNCACAQECPRLYDHVTGNNLTTQIIPLVINSLFARVVYLTRGFIHYNNTVTWITDKNKPVVGESKEANLDIQHCR